MSNETNIAPVLTDEEWRSLERGRPVHCVGVDGDQFIGFVHDRDTEGEGVMIDGGSYTASLFEAENVRRLIAVANEALPKDDPRKITREKIIKLREMIGYAAGAYTSSAESADLEADEAMLAPFLDALGSYLPPAVTSS